jgi:hypothetical protein
MPPPNLYGAVENLFDSLAAQPSATQCLRCGSELMYLETTFLSLGGKIWTLPLPVCPRCDLKTDTAQFVPPVAC